MRELVRQLVRERGLGFGKVLSKPNQASVLSREICLNYRRKENWEWYRSYIFRF
jgi:hypothetical protein